MKKVHIFAGALLLGMFGPAHAKYCCDPWGFVGFAAFVQAGTGVVSTLTSSTMKIVNEVEAQLRPTIANGFGQAYLELSKQTAHRRVFMEGRMSVDSAAAIQRDSAYAAINAVPAAQQSLTVASAALAAEQAAVVRSKTQAADLAFSQNFQAAARSSQAGVLARHARYCSAVDIDRMKCDGLAASSLQNADLSIGTIQNPGEGQHETLADQERDAARTFVDNVVLPWPYAPTPAGDTGTAQAQAYEALLLADQAAISLAAHSLNSQIEYRSRRHQP